MIRSSPDPFAARRSVAQVEEGTELAPRFDRDGLLVAVTTDAASGEVLMVGMMNGAALRLTLETGEAHYWSRSRRTLWRKGATSGFVQRVLELRVDDDQDAVWLRVDVAGGASCHVGYRSCFYRAVALDATAEELVRLVFCETERKSDPSAVYGDAPNPTQL